MALSLPIPVPMDKIADFCRRHGIQQLSLFGSILRDDFRPDSDIDIMLQFEPGRGFTFENTPIIIDELRTLFGRDVDVIEKDRIRNRFRREAIMSSHRVLYAA